MFEQTRAALKTLNAQWSDAQIRGMHWLGKGVQGQPSAR